MKEEEILKSVVNNLNLVKLHRPWGYYIATPFEAIRMIGFIDKATHYELSLFFGDTQRQSRAFYNLKPQINQFDFKGWTVAPNFHLQNSFGENLIWFESKLSNQEYIDFWVNNRQLLYKHEKWNIDKLISILENSGVITLDNVKKQELETILSKEYSAFNICAGFSLIFNISKNDVTSLESNAQLSNFLIDKINYGLSFIGENGNGFLKDLNKETEGNPPGL